MHAGKVSHPTYVPPVRRARGADIGGRGTHIQDRSSSTDFTIRFPTTRCALHASVLKQDVEDWNDKSFELQVQDLHEIPAPRAIVAIFSGAVFSRIQSNPTLYDRAHQVGTVLCRLGCTFEGVMDHFLWLSSLALLRLDNNSTATTTEEYYNGAQAYLSFISSEFASLVILLLLEAARKLGLERFEPNTTA